MRFLIIRTFPSILDPNGYNIQEIGFAKALVRAGHVCDVILFNGSNGDEIKEISVEVTDGSRVTVYMRHGFGILKNGFFPGLKGLVKDYDVLQVHEYDQISSWKYYAFCKDKRVVIYHGPYYDSYNTGYNFKCKVFDNTFLKIKNNREALCFTKSRAAGEFLKGKGFKNVYPIGVGLDVDNFSSTAPPTDAPENLLPRDRWNLIYVGKIEPRRNSYLLLDIIRKLYDRHPEMHLLVIGGGEKAYLDEWKRKAQPLMEEGALTYVEKMSQQKLRGIYEHPNLMLFPSNYEIFGMVLLEAMYFDLPIISSDNGGSDTLITDGEDGIIVKEFDADSWVTAVEKLYLDKAEYDRIKGNLKAKDHAVYTWDGIVEKYLQLICI